MMEKGVSPNATCVNAAMHGFAIQREWESAMHLLRTMEVQYGCAPDAVSPRYVQNCASFPHAHKSVVQATRLIFFFFYVDDAFITCIPPILLEGNTLNAVICPRLLHMYQILRIRVQACDRTC